MKGEGHCSEFSRCLRGTVTELGFELGDEPDATLAVSIDNMKTSSDSSDTLVMIFNTALSGRSSYMSVRLHN